MDWRDESVPPKVVDAAAKHGLGVLLTSARSSGLSPAMRGMGAVGLVVVLPYAIAVLVNALGVPHAVGGPVIGIAVLGGLIALILLWARGRTLYLFDGGAVVVRDRKEVVEVVPWAEMVPIEADQRNTSRIGSGGRTFPALYINSSRGRAFACTHDEAVRLADVISSVEVRRAEAELRRGRSVAYGSVILTPNSLVVGPTAVPWGDVTRLRADGVWFTVRGAGAIGATELRRIPRAAVHHQRTVIALGERWGAQARQPHAG